MLPSPATERTGLRQVVLTRRGGPEALVVREVPEPSPAAGEVRIRTRLAGVNFADVMVRLGLYPDAPPLPHVPGYELAGVIDAVGPGVAAGRVGERVAALCRFGGLCRGGLRSRHARLRGAVRRE